MDHVGVLLPKIKKIPKMPTDGWLSQHQLGFLFSLTLDGHDLKRRLIAEWQSDTQQQSIVDGAVDQWRKRLRYCVETSGRHFEHLL